MLPGMLAKLLGEDGRRGSSEEVVRVHLDNEGGAARQEDLRGKLFVFLYDNNVVDFDRADAVADRLMDLAKANHAKLARGT